MTPSELDRRFLDSTRGQVVALLRRGPRTVDELARELRLTDNAVRNHLSLLERDGVVRQGGVRRGAGAGKPAVLFEIRPDAESLFSRAYPAALAMLSEVLADELSPETTERVMREVGRRLARDIGGRRDGPADERARAAALVLESLGGVIDVSRSKGTVRLQGHGCPLSVAVSRRPEVCRLVESMVSELTGTSARSCCEHGERPRCCFEIDAAS